MMVPVALSMSGCGTTYEKISPEEARVKQIVPQCEAEAKQMIPPAPGVVHVPGYFESGGGGGGGRHGSSYSAWSSGDGPHDEVVDANAQLRQDTYDACLARNGIKANRSFMRGVVQWLAEP